MKEIEEWYKQQMHELDKRQCRIRELQILETKEQSTKLQHEAQALTLEADQVDDCCYAEPNLAQTMKDEAQRRKEID